MARFRKNLKGYNIDEVDSFLKTIADRIEHGAGMLPAEILDARFRLGLRGYDVKDVDAYLERIARSISQ